MFMVINFILDMICINRKKDIVKKGFTLVELIAVISILSVILLIGIPTYTYINNKTKENLYTSKVNELLAKGSVYAEETGLFAFSVNTLVEEGKISPDNESGQILDPRDQRKMNCDIIRVVYENNQYEASYAMSDECLSDEELNNQYGMFQIIVKNKEGDVVSDYDTWHNVTEYYLSYELKEEYQNFASNILSVTWSGEGDKTCSIDNLAECDTYLVSATSVKRTTIVLKIEMNINESRLSTTYKVNLQMDNESPILVPGSMNYDNTIPTTEKRKVTFELSDNLGSGVSSYSLSPNKECDNYKESSDGLQTEYLDNGEYYLCVKDNVGLETSYFDDNDKIVITNVDNKDLTIYLTNSSSGTWAKNNVDINVISNKDKMDFCLYKYDNNEYARYNKSFISSKLILDSITEEQERKLTLVCYDSAGNSSNEVSTNVKIDKTGPTISYAVASSTAGTSGWYKKLLLKVTLADSKSGVSSAKYCTTTNSSCTPTTGVTLTNNTFNINIPNGKQVLCTTATDKVGNSTTKCSSTYSVDGSNPSVSYSIASKTTGENSWYKALSIKASLSDSTSGVRTAKYCEIGSSTCTPGTNATISSNAFNVSLSNGSNRKVCVNVTDWAGNTSGTTCSSAYSIDNTVPTAKISATCSGSQVKVSASGSTDSGSGIGTYYYKVGNGSYVSSTSNSYSFSSTGGTFYVKVKDKAGNVSKEVSQSVNCGPSYNLKYTFDQYKQIIPLNSKQMLIVTGYIPGTRNNKSGYDYFDSYTTIQIINVNTDGSISFGTETKVLTGERGSAYSGVLAARIDDTHIMVMGMSARAVKYTKEYTRKQTFSVITITGNSMSVAASTSKSSDSFYDWGIRYLGCNGRTCYAESEYYSGAHDFYVSDTVTWNGGSTVSYDTTRSSRYSNTDRYPIGSYDPANRYGCPVLSVPYPAFTTVGLSSGVCVLQPSSVSGYYYSPTINGTRYDLGYTYIAGTSVRVQKTGTLGRLSSNRFTIMSEDTMYFYNYTNGDIVAESKTLKVPTVTCTTNRYNQKKCTERSFISAGDHLYLLVEGKYLYLIQG